MPLTNKQIIVCPKTGELILVEVSPESIARENDCRLLLSKEEHPYDEDGNNLIYYDDEENNYGQQYDYETDDSDDEDYSDDEEDQEHEEDHFSKMINEVWAELCQK